MEYQRVEDSEGQGDCQNEKEKASEACDFALDLCLGSGG